MTLLEKSYQVEGVVSPKNTKASIFHLLLNLGL
jgi:hypothetical protein